MTGRKVVSIKKSKMKRRQKIIGGPKKPMSSFLLYCQDKRPEVKAELGEASQSIAQVGKRLGQMWQEESVEVKQRYKERADLDKMRYERVRNICFVIILSRFTGFNCLFQQFWFYGFAGIAGVSAAAVRRRSISGDGFRLRLMCIQHTKKCCIARAMNY